MSQRRLSTLPHFSDAMRLIAATWLAAAQFLPDAHAGSALEDWHSEVAAVRQLAENAPQRALDEAQRLYSAFPAEGTAADRARIFNLRSRIEVYLALTEPAAADAENALATAKESGDKVGQAEAYLNIALNAINQGRIAAASDAATNALALLDGADRPDLLGEAMLRTAMMYRRAGHSEAAATLSMQALDMAEANGNPIFLAHALHGMAIAQEQSGRYDEAQAHYRRMAEQGRAAGSKLLETYALRGLASMASHQGQFQHAEKSIREVIEAFRTLGMPFNLCHSLYLQSDNLRRQGRRREAAAVLDEVVAIYERHPNKIGLWWSFKTRSDDHLALGQTALAAADAERAYALAKDIGAAVYLSGSARQLAELAAARGDYRQAYELSRQAAETATTGESQLAGERMEQLAERYKAEVKQRRIDELTRAAERSRLEQRWLWTVLAASVLLLSLTAAFLLRQRRANRMLAELNAEVQLASRKLQATLDAIPDLLFEIDLEGRIHDYHSPRTDLLTVPPEQFLNKRMRDVLPPEAEEVCMAALREADSTGRSTGKQYALGLPQGTAWFELSVARKPDVPGRLPRFVTLSRDITERKAAEHELRLLQSAMNQSSDGMFVKDLRSGRFVNVNDAACRSLGYSRDELLGMTVPDIDPDVTAEMIAQAHKSAEFGKPHMLETRHRGKDGRIFPVEITGAFFEDSGVPYAISLVRNVTARKRIENTLHFIANPGGERDFLAGLARHLGESLGAGYVIIDKPADDPGIVETVALYAHGEIRPNLRYALAGTPCENVAGKRICCYPSGVQALFPEDALLADMGVESYAGVPLWDSTGQPIGLIAVMDVAPMTDEAAATQLLQIVAPRAAAELERARSDAQLQASEQAFRALVENSPDSVVRYDRECRRIYLNPTALSHFGRPAEEVLGRTPQQLSPYLDPGHFVGLLRHVFETGEVMANEQAYRSADDSMRWGHTRLVPEYGPDGAIASVLATVRDITDLKMAENRLRESYALLQELTSRRETAREEERKRIAREIHDELGQQLTALRLKVNLLKLQFGDDAPAVREATAGLLALVDRTIQVARSVSTSLRPAVLDMGIGPALDWLAGEFVRNTGIACELGPMPADFHLNEEQSIVLFRIAQESLTNVARHAEATRVSITLTGKDGGYAMEIADDGVGFDASNPRRHKFGLVGMRERGLAASGETSIDSAPGRGTRVRVFIPITETGEVS